VRYTRNMFHGWRFRHHAYLVPVCAILEGSITALS
jgi:hypothetical protein